MTRKTEASGDFTDFTYDTTGRLVQEAGTAFTDFNGQSVTPATDYYYDGLNNLTRTREQGTTGTAGAGDALYL